jgi:two-component system NarL family response regulator
MRVLLVDDHQLLVEGLSNLLAAHGIAVAGVACDGRAAVLQALALDPDLILMDLRMPVCDGLTATRLIKAQRPAIKIVILTTSAEDQDLFTAIQSGACGYLLKSISGKAFIEALHGLEEGAPPFSPGLAARLLAEFARISSQSPPAADPAPELGPGHAVNPAAAPTALTPRQIDVLRLVASGLTYKEVGQQLALSERTVRYHMAEIMERLHLEHRSQVIAYAGKMGISTST